MLFRTYRDLLPLNIVYFVLENGNFVLKNNLSCAFSFRYWLTNSYAIFGTPYFYYDVGIMIMIYSHLHPTPEDISWYQMSLCLLRDHSLMLLHHIVFPIIYLPVIVVSSPYILQSHSDLANTVFLFISYY